LPNVKLRSQSLGAGQRHMPTSPAAYHPCGARAAAARIDLVPNAVVSVGVCIMIHYRYTDI